MVREHLILSEKGKSRATPANAGYGFSGYRWNVSHNNLDYGKIENSPFTNITSDFDYVL
jgi:hypothetical protein